MPRSEFPTAAEQQINNFKLVGNLLRGMDNWDKIFKTYDVRGVYPKEINRKVAYKIGRGVAIKIRPQRVKNLAIGRDNRLSSDDLFQGICDGIRDEGINVVNFGLVTTPILYYAMIKMDLDAGIMITASHNPKEYNGFKIIKKGGIPLDEKDFEKIKQIIQKSDFGSGKKQAFLIDKNALKTDIIKDYVDNIIDFSRVSDIKPLKVVVDTGNGVAGIVIPELAKQLPINLDNIFSELDGNFPNHNPNPVILKNTEVLQEKVLSEKADLGVAFDGDADRILFIDERGERIDSDLIAAVIIHYYFKRAGKILCTAASSKIVKEEAIDSGNEIIFERIGYTFIRKRMEREKVIFGCESSGHYYFKDTNYVESPFLVLIKILELISRTKMPLSDLVNQFQRFYQDRSAIPFSNLNKARFCIGNIEAEYKKIHRFGRIGKFSYIDGVSVEYPDWWFNIRISNTEPVLRLTIEADTKELLEEMKQKLLKLIPF